MSADYFDQWFVDIARSPARQRLFTEHLGLPEEVGPSNLMPLKGLRVVATALTLKTGDQLVDLACGRGGPGMWIARETGAQLVGIDFSEEAVAQAASRRALFGLDTDATFAVGSLESTGLPPGGADAVVCIDAFQFASDGVQAAEEIRRILRPGGRVVLTSWDPVDHGDEAVPERLRTVDLVGSLTAAGFRDASREERPEWHEVARSLWQAAMATNPGDDPALVSTREEAERSLANRDRVNRVMATAVAP